VHVIFLQHAGAVEITDDDVDVSCFILNHRHPGLSGFRR